MRILLLAALALKNGSAQGFWKDLLEGLSGVGALIDSPVGSMLVDGLVDGAGRSFSDPWPAAAEAPAPAASAALRSGLAAAGLSAAELREASWRARIAGAAYSRSEEVLRLKLVELECELQSFSRQAIQSDDQPQWFTCLRRQSGELVVAFRGTMSKADALADIETTPVAVSHLQPINLHSGFLQAIRKAWSGGGLDAQLAPDLLRQAPRVILVGHSLGGALVLTLLASGLLPTAAPGKYLASTFGAPAVIHGVQPLREHLCNAVVEQWVFEDDVVPRLLGSDYSALQQVLQPIMGASSWLANWLGAADQDWYSMFSAILRMSHSMAGHSTSYIHPGVVKVFWLHERAVWSIPASRRQAVLNMDRSLSDFSLAALKRLLKGGTDHAQFTYVAALGSLEGAQTSGRAEM